MKRLIVTYAHVRTVPFSGGRGYCSRKAREWFGRYGLSWSDFVRNGIAAERLLATGCALAAAVVEHAENVERGQDGKQQ